MVRQSTNVSSRFEGAQRGDDVPASFAEQRGVLLQVMLLNLLLSSALAATGISADSSGLIANALDNPRRRAGHGPTASR